MSTFGIPKGAFTAFITPFKYGKRKVIDWDGQAKLYKFQAAQGVSGGVPMGTTGETPTATEREHHLVNSTAIATANGLFIVNGCGSNNLLETMRYVGKVVEAGGKAVLLVDCYYNGPSSLELRNEYYGPIAKAFPGIAIFPYIIPGRTGCVLFVEDLAALNQEYPNICGVKEATGNIERMMLTRSLTSPDFQIFSGDDDMTFEMMTNPAIGACGVISVVSNLAPAATQQMCQAILRNDLQTAKETRLKLQPLFEIVTVFADRIEGQRTVIDKFRNPDGIKTAMNGLGMPAGPCRPPLGKMSLLAVQKVHAAITTVWRRNPEVLRPIEEFFHVSIDDQLANSKLWESLSY